MRLIGHVCQGMLAHKRMYSLTWPGAMYVLLRWIFFFLLGRCRQGRQVWMETSLEMMLFPAKTTPLRCHALSGNKLGNKLFQGFTFWHTMRGAGHTSFTRRRQIGQLIFEAMTGTFHIRRPLPPHGHFCRFLCAVHLLAAKRNRMKMIFYDCFAKLHKYTIKTATRVLL